MRFLTESHSIWVKAVPVRSICTVFRISDFTFFDFAVNLYAQRRFESSTFRRQLECEFMLQTRPTIEVAHFRLDVL